MRTEAKAATDAATGAQDAFVPAGPLNAKKRISNTIYEVEIYVKNHTEAAETIEDKILRLVRNDLNYPLNHVKMVAPQTSRLPERGLL
jgi:hypothetical protein